MAIYEALRIHYDIQQKLQQLLVNTSGDTATREQCFIALKHELKFHKNPVEPHFYNPLIKEDMTQNYVKHGIAEHYGIEEVVETLEKTNHDSLVWIKYIKNQKNKVEHHLKDENILPFS
mgnify:CR=1 FL=1